MPKHLHWLAIAMVSVMGVSSGCAQTPASAKAKAWTMVEAGQGQATARHEGSAAAVGGEMFLIGGRGERPLDILDLATGAWRQGAAPPFEINHGQAAVLDGKIYMAGALNGPYPRENIIPNIVVYDPATNAWSTGPALPADRQRGGGGFVVHEGVFYMIGGNRLGHQSGFVPWVDAFDPGSGVWTQLADAPHARDHFHAAVLDGKIYAPGGRTSAADKGDPIGLSVLPMDIFDIATRTWSTAAAPIPTPRSGVSVVAADGRIVVIGGESATQQAAHAEVEAYDPSTGQWTSLPDMPVGRHGMQAVVVDGAIHAAAGSRNRGGGPELNDHWVLDARQ